MTFLKCSIQGKKYGETSPDEVEKEVVVPTGEVVERENKKSDPVRKAIYTISESF